VFDVLEGVIWLAIATAAELPLAVSLASFIVVHALFLLIAILVAPVFKSER